MKIKWREKEIKKAVPGFKVFVMIAEPGLCVRGSGFYTLEKGDVINSLNEVLSATKSLTMVHCCGNIDWAILMDTKACCISFDTYVSSEYFAFYYEALRAYLNQGNTIAWGLVPAIKETFESETLSHLVARFENTLQIFTAKGFEKQMLLRMAYITSSCSVAGMPVEMAEQVYHATQKIAHIFREKMCDSVVNY